MSPSRICPDCGRVLTDTEKERKREIRKLVKSAKGDTPRVINIELPGVCPYLLLCKGCYRDGKSRSWSYSLKYHTDIRERMESHSNWGCIGGSNMKECSGYKIHKTKEKAGEYMIKRFCDICDAELVYHRVDLSMKCIPQPNDRTDIHLELCKGCADRINKAINIAMHNLQVHEVELL